jgi:hypothetical protein
MPAPGEMAAKVREAAAKDDAAAAAVAADDGAVIAEAGPFAAPAPTPDTVEPPDV